MDPETNTPSAVEIKECSFQAEVIKSEQPVLVGFCAQWSRPCHVLDKVLDEVAAALAGKARVVKVNADDCLDLSLWYEIRSVPTLLYFVHGEPQFRVVGTATKEAILARIATMGDTA